MYTVKQPTNEVKFNKKYYELIKDGIKTQTMRLARKRLDVNEGDVVNAIFPGTDLSIPIKILKIGYKQAKSINLDDAIREGYNEISSLLNELYHIYPNMNLFDRLYYYQFKVIREKPNFNVVEGELDDYWDDYEEFIRLYNENKIPVTEIRDRLNMKIKKYYSYRETAIKEGRLNIDSRGSPSKRFKHSKRFAKNYHKSGSTFKVCKTIKGKNIVFGYYKTEDDAKKVVAELRKVDWDKKELPRIIEELGV